MSIPLESLSQTEQRGTVLLVDDEPAVTRTLARVLAGRGYDLETCSTATEAMQRVARGGVLVVVTDVAMPHVSGVQLLRAVREHDPDVPVVLITGVPDIQTATAGIDWGAFKYLVKPVQAEALCSAVDRAVQMHRLALMKRTALAAAGERDAAEQARLRESFERAMQTLWVAFQPIVRASDNSVFGYEALLRSDEPSLPGPGHVVDAAERLGYLERLGRTIRSRAVEPLENTASQAVLFLNLHPRDLADPELLNSDSALAQMARRVVLEVTERASLASVDNLRAKIGRLRELGYRIALDDIGAGYAGLSSFAVLEPEIVKLDMSLVRDIETSPVKQKLVASMVALCRDMGLDFVAEGVETPAERDTLLRLGCELFQGYLFGRPGRAFPEPRWPSVLHQGLQGEGLPSSGTHAIHAVGDPPSADVPVAAPSTAPHDERFVPLSVLDSLGEGVTLTNAEGRILFSNRAADRILGVGASDGGADEWGDYYGIFLPDGKTRFPTEQYPLVRALAGEATDNVQMLIRNSGVPNGVWIAATGRPLLGTDGAVLGACVVFRDVTSERSSEQAISRAHTELQAAQQRQSELSTFLVHDLKSPLTGILGSVGMLLDGPQPPDERECLLDIRDSARSMHRMVLDILDVHTAEDGVLSVHLQNVNLKALLEQVHAVMSPRASLRKQRLEIASQPEHRTVSADPNLLVRVLQNLVDNCIKYGPSGGFIWIDAELGPHMLTLRVRDEGPGVPPALRERIFEKYARLERDLTARHRDSRGLGLRFCRVAADAHGGRIWVEDNLPKGACFVLELPLRGPVP